MMATRLVNHCERFFGHTESLKKKTLNDVKFLAPIDKSGDRFQFDLKAETFISSKKPLASFNVSSSAEVPDISPLDQCISIPIVENYIRRSLYRKLNLFIIRRSIDN